MRTYLFCMTMLFFCIPLFSQNEQALVVGVESSFVFYNANNYPTKDAHFSTIAGVTVEKPWKKLSFSTGILLKNAPNHQFAVHNGENRIKIVKEEPITLYGYQRYDQQLRYLSIPLRIQYRLPCNCVYFQGGVELDLIGNNPKLTQVSTYESQEVPVITETTKQFKEVGYTLVFGMGFKLHQSERFRIFMRPDFEYVFNPGTKQNQYFQEDFRKFKMSFGAQYIIK